ncbi:MAG: hypothetical protein WBO10_15495 [Pyrinomonadaceae bacterium]
MQRRHINNLFISGLILLGIIFVSTSDGFAQGRYVNVYSKKTVRSYVDRLEKSSNTFKKDFDKYMDRSDLNGTDTEDRYNEIVKDYENSLDRLQRQFNGFNTWWESRSNVQEMLDRAQPVNSMVNGLPFSRNIERQWRSMRDDINKVADTYDLAGLNGGGWNGGGPGGGWPGGPGAGGQMSTPPSWAQGQWYAVNGQNAEMTISRNGHISTKFAGVMMNGRYYRGTVFVGTDQATISRVGNNLRLKTRNGAVTDYTRSSFGGGGSGGFNGAPGWAVGNWSNTDGRITRTLVIQANGPVNLYINGAISYGNWERGGLRIDRKYYTVTSQGNDLRLYDQSTRQTLVFSRQR